MSGAKTIIVLGIARSGTSLASQVLDNLGVNMGDHKTQGSYEDLDFSNLISSNRPEAIKYIQAKNAKEQSWGFKLTHSFKDLLPLLKHINAPLFVVPFRDVASIIKRRNIAQPKPLDFRVNQIYRQSLSLLSFLEKVTAPIFLYSHQSALNEPLKFVESITEFSGLAASINQQKEVASKISSVNNEYQQAFYHNHKDHLPNESAAINTGEINVVKTLDPKGKDVMAGYHNLETSDTMRIAPVKRAYLKALSKSSIRQLTYYVEDILSRVVLDKPSRRAALWEIRRTLFIQQKFLKAIINAKHSVNMISAEKSASIVNSGQDSTDPVFLKLDELQETENEYRCNIAIDEHLLKGWVVCLGQEDKVTCDVYINESKHRVVCNQEMKSEETLAFSVHKNAFSLKLTDTPKISDIRIIPEGRTMDILNNR